MLHLVDAEAVGRIAGMTLENAAEVAVVGKTDLVGYGYDGCA